ncbi:MAG: hypothetical protein ACM3RX_00755, partial [Methanococcaceae archaeon]
QDKQKPVKKLFCTVDKDHYFIKGPEQGELVLEHNLHMYSHNIRLSDKQYDSLFTVQADMKINRL